MVEYRGGVGSKRSNSLWHFNWNCLSYPDTAYVIRKDKPSGDDLCAKCHDRVATNGPELTLGH